MSITVIEGDCLATVPKLEIDCIFADPPDNIGLGYDQYADDMLDTAYQGLLWDWVSTFYKQSPVVWISFNAKHTALMGWIVIELWKRHKFNYKTCVQTFTFGQHNKHDLGNNHRPLWRITWEGVELFPDDIRVQSDRQKQGDKRADPRGRVPGDVFDFPRVTGNSRQRRSWHPTQLHEDLVERALRLTTKPGDHVVDPFGGTGTTGRVCKKIDRNCTLIDIDPGYCAKMWEELC